MRRNNGTSIYKNCFIRIILLIKVMKTEIRNSKLLRKENNAIIESCYVSAKDSHDKGNIST